MELASEKFALKGKVPWVRAHILCRQLPGPGGIALALTTRRGCPCRRRRCTSLAGPRPHTRRRPVADGK
jgi:hypothetical protein